VSGQTLDDVKARGSLNCGVTTGLTGFAAPDADGEWEGFDVAVCRAVAAAVLGDPMAVEFVPDHRPDALHRAGLRRDRHAGPEHHLDLQPRRRPEVRIRRHQLLRRSGLHGSADLGVSSAMDLDGATVCIQTGTTTELNLADFFRVEQHELRAGSDRNQRRSAAAVPGGACDVYTTDASGLAATRATFEDPGAHVVLPEIVSKEPLGPLVRHGDNEWGDIVRWTLNALISAEELGVTSANIAELAGGTNNPEINRLLGTEGNLGEMLGLDADWA
jgi:general L-amino acid transport system substrate-binding protein